MKILVVVDMQNDFITGSLGTKDAQNILPNVKEKIDRFISEGHTVIYTRDTHGENYLNTEEGRKLPVIHCVKNSFGWQIEESLKREECPVIDKYTFGSIELAEYIRKKSNGDIEEIQVIGLCTDICVISNALILKSSFPEVPLYVDSKCTAGSTKEGYETALKQMSLCQIEII